MKEKVELGLFAEEADLYLELTLSASQWAEIQGGKQLLVEGEEFYAEPECLNLRETHGSDWIFNRVAAAKSLSVRCCHCGFSAYAGSWTDAKASKQ